MADSWDEAFGEYDSDVVQESPDASLAAHDGVEASVARYIYHVYDLEDADTSDDEYHEAMANLRAYGDSMRRKVKARIDGHGEEVEQLDVFEEDESSGDDSEEEDGLAGDNGVNEEQEDAEQAEVPPMQEARRADSNHSSYRLSEDSNHVKANLSDSEGGDIFDDAPQYDPHCNHNVLQSVPRMKFASSEEFKAAVVRHSVAVGAGLRWVRVEKSRREVKCKDKNCKWNVYASWFRRN
ncbi:unnamed protein product [Linum trigynum]|uniref:Transposase MuDR plant domain-containing protein n=1 Tax=Linum trigynum TaxID=586398 RepID=A0AAV2CC93_9ROSI